jgi:hypothetical protein
MDDFELLPWTTLKSMHVENVANFDISQIEYLNGLRRLKIIGAKSLTIMPNFPNLIELEYSGALDLSNCTSLETLKFAFAGEFAGFGKLSSTVKTVELSTSDNAISSISDYSQFSSVETLTAHKCSLDGNRSEMLALKTINVDSILNF